MIYLDHAASTYPYPEVVALYEKYFPTLFANPSAAHAAGYNVKRQIQDARKRIATALACPPDSLWVCSGATEAINTAIKAYLLWTKHPGDEALIAAGEHAAVRQAAAFACARGGQTLKTIPLTPQGKPDLEALATLLSEKTTLVATMAVNNETGAVTDLDTVGRLLRERAPQAKWLVDGVQALCKIPFDLRAVDCDFAIFSGHKIHAPKGVGLLYVKPGLRLEPLLHGGGQQEGRRAGTENALPLLALATALEIGLQHIDANRARVSHLREIFLTTLANDRYVINSPPDASPYILNLSFPGLRGETLMNALSSREIYLSTASSCHSKAPYSEVLQAMELPPIRLESAVRLSFDARQNEEEMRSAAECCNEMVSRYRLH